MPLSVDEQAAAWFSKCSKLSEEFRDYDWVFFCSESGSFAREICSLGADSIIHIIQSFEVLSQVWSNLLEEEWDDLHPFINMLFPSQDDLWLTLRLLRFNRNYWCHFGIMDHLASQQGRLDCEVPALNSLFLIARLRNIRLVSYIFFVLSLLIVLQN